VKIFQIHTNFQNRIQPCVRYMNGLELLVIFFRLFIIMIRYSFTTIVSLIERLKPSLPDTYRPVGLYNDLLYDCILTLGVGGFKKIKPTACRNSSHPFKPSLPRKKNTRKRSASRANRRVGGE
jgi:hypothetical protein